MSSFFLDGQKNKRYKESTMLNLFCNFSKTKFIFQNHNTFKTIVLLFYFLYFKINVLPCSILYYIYELFA